MALIATPSLELSLPSSSFSATATPLPIPSSIASSARISTVVVLRPFLAVSLVHLRLRRQHVRDRHHCVRDGPVQTLNLGAESPSLRQGRASPGAVARRQRLMRQNSSAASSPMSLCETRGCTTYRKYTQNLTPTLYHHHHHDDRRQQQQQHFEVANISC